MKAVIIGCGEVGLAVAGTLTAGSHDVVMIDMSEKAADTIPDDLDVMLIQGKGNAVSTLREADVEHTDALIAVTDSDEVNLLCCLIAKKISPCLTIARVRDPVYLQELNFIRERLGINLIINPEFAAAREISRLLLFPGADRVVTFARNRVLFTNGRIRKEQKLDGVSLADAAERIGSEVLIAAVLRNGELYIPNGSFVLHDDDDIYILASAENTRAFYRRMGFGGTRLRKVLIAGGGTTAFYLAQMLIKMKVDVHIIEKSQERAEELADKLPDAVVIRGDATDKDTLMNLGLPGADAFITLMGADEGNVMISLFAKSKTDARLIMKVEKTAFRDIISELHLESAVYPDQMTTDFIIQYLRSAGNTKGNHIETLYFMFDGRAEALEFAVRRPSLITDTPLRDLHLLNNTLIGCINRHGRVIIPGGNDRILPGDTVVVITEHHGLRDLTDILA